VSWSRRFSVSFFPLQKSAAQNKKPTRLASGLEFLFIAMTTNSPLASYLGGTQNRNQYEWAVRIMARSLVNPHFRSNCKKF
jgi:hypothetical protein